MILELKIIKSITVSIVSPSTCHEVMGFPGGTSSKEPACQSRREVRDTGSILGSGRSSGSRVWWSTPVFLPGESHGQRSLAWGYKELDMTEWLSLSLSLSMGPDAMIFIFWMLNFKPTFSLSSFTFIKRLFSSSSLSAIRLVSSAYLRLLIFLPAILIPTWYLEKRSLVFP